MNAAVNEEPSFGLSPEATALVETYFSRVHGALLVAAASECEDAVGELRQHVLEELAGSAGTPADVTRVLAELGPPEAVAAQCAEIVTDVRPAAPVPGEKRARLAGTILGVPYEFRPPTGERVASRWWDPLDRHIFVPRLFGVGWTINFGALAVRVGLVRPDDEDVPFASVPERYLTMALVLPLVIAAGLGVLVALYQGGLPAQVVVNYGFNGMPDRYASKETALLFPVGMTLIGLALAVAARLRRRRPLVRAATAAFATMLGSISLAAYGQQIVTARGASGVAILLPGLAGALVLTFGLLVALSRIGRAAEMRRDLEETSKKGSVR